MRSIFEFSEARKQINKIFLLVSHGNEKKLPEEKKLWLSGRI